MSGVRISLSNIQYTYEWFNKDISSLIEQLRDKPFDLIVGISRGGCIPAVCLSHALKVPTTMIDVSTRDGANIHPISLSEFFMGVYEDYSSVLIVDDLIDSGRSMDIILASAKLFGKPTLATLLHNVEVNTGVEHYYGTAFSRVDEPRYFDFWWEKFK